MSKLKINVDIILEEENRKYLIIGLNETLGSFGSLSIAMNLFKYYSGIFPDINNCIEYYLCLGGFRSYLKEFLDYIIFLKTKKKDVNLRLKKRKNFNQKLLNILRKSQLTLKQKKNKSNYVLVNNFNNAIMKRKVKILKTKILNDRSSS